MTFRKWGLICQHVREQRGQRSRFPRIHMQREGLFQDTKLCRFIIGRNGVFTFRRYRRSVGVTLGEWILHSGCVFDINHNSLQQFGLQSLHFLENRWSHCVLGKLETPSKVYSFITGLAAEWLRHVQAEIQVFAATTPQHLPNWEGNASDLNSCQL